MEKDRVDGDPVDDGGDSVDFVALHKRCPDVAARETRTLTFREGQGRIPPDDYAFVESFCQGKDCDCRRVMFLVLRQSTGQHVLTINFGWEPLAWYTKYAQGDATIAAYVKGPEVELNGPLFNYSHELFEVFKTHCLFSPEYVDRVRRHYALFKGYAES